MYGHAVNSLRTALLGHEMTREPVRGQIGDAAEGTRLVERVRGTWHHGDAVRAAQPRPRRPIQLSHDGIAAADDQQCRCENATQSRSSEVGAPATGNHCADSGVRFGRRPQRRAGAGTHAEHTNRQPGTDRLAADPFDDLDQPPTKQAGIENVGARRLLRQG